MKFRYRKLITTGLISAGLAQIAAAEIVQGTVTDANGRSRWRTSYAAAYPPDLARAIARVVFDAAPRSGRRTNMEPKVTTPRGLQNNPKWMLR